MSSSLHSSSPAAKHDLSNESHVATTPSTASPFDNQASPAGSTLATSMSSASSQQGEDMKLIHCRWQECSKTYDDPEDLYQHLCNDHVGRKSTNNLCLSCKWEGCDVTCAKRDHITSHLRVHTPLKPHACDACGKLFKRPQDLKKHERIHTEQHHQARQLKYQANPSSLSAYNVQQGMARYGMEQGPGAAAAAAAAAAWASARGGDVGHSHPSSSNMYHGGANVGGQPLYHSHGVSSQGMYPSLPGTLRHLSSTAGASAPSTYASHHPLEAGSTGASLSPMSSHLGTPGSVSSPASHGHQYYNHPNNGGNNVPYQNTVGGTERGYLDLQHDRPKPNDDPNSYAYLAQGSSLAGSKRSFDATATFFEDVRRKRLAPTYDSAMAARLENSFSGGIDDATLHAILSSFDANGANLSAGSGTEDAGHTSSDTATAVYNAHNANANKLSLPEALKQTDLAELNAFLLQVGANAARADGSVNANGHNNSSSQSMHSINAGQQHAFDFQAALAASGLSGIAGFDENLLTTPDYTSAPVTTPSIASSSVGDGVSPGNWLYNNASHHRPIAHLPQRASFMGSAHQMQGGNAGGYPSSAMSFDSMRISRGPAYVPQLGAKELSNPTYRHVEALTRAAPDVERSVSAPSSSSTAKNVSGNAAKTEDQDDHMDETDDSFASPSLSSAVPGSSTFTLYPRMTRGDPSRRLPVPTSNERSFSGPSIASILTSSSSSSLTSARDSRWRDHQARASFSSSSPSPPPSTIGDTSEGGDDAHIRSLYPRLSPIHQRKGSLQANGGALEGIAHDVAALDVASPLSQPSDIDQEDDTIDGDSGKGNDSDPLNTHSPISMNVRHHHARLIIDLLIALNYPRLHREGDAAAYTLAPLRSNSLPEASKADEAMDQSITPKLKHKQVHDQHTGSDSDERSDDTAHASGRMTSSNQIDNAPSSRSLPHIQSLLNDVDVPVKSELRGAGGRRIMDIDV